MAFRDLIVRAVKPTKLSCPKCELDRKNFVPSKIVLNSEIAFVGEAPGRNEVILGEPFVGKAGKIVRAAAAEEGVIPESCSWLNVVKCRPPNNETPDKLTIARCGKKYLYPELLTLQPRIVILLGKSAFSYFFSKKDWDKSLHNFRRRGEFVFLTTRHPAAVLHEGGPFSPNGGKIYRSIKKDIKKARQFIDGTLYSDREYTLVDGPVEAKRWADFLIKQPMISADIECTNLRSWAPSARLLTVAFSWADKKAVCFPVDHHEFEDEQVKEAIREQLARVLACDNIKLWHNAKFDVPWLRESGWEVNGKIVCTMVMAYLIDENKKRYGLKQLSAEELEGYNDIIDGDEFKKVSLERLYYYNCEDVDNTRRLFFILRKRMDKKLWWVHNELIIPASMAVAEAERVGLRWDIEGGRHLKAKLNAEARDLIRKANKELPTGMTVTSPNDLREYMYNIKKYPVISETDKGTPQVNEYCLTVLAEEHKCKMAKDVIEIREREKIVGTYLDAYPKFVGFDGRLHATCWFTHTVTGRTAFTDPNPQQLPRRGDVRELIMAADGMEFIYGDLSTVEMRIAASLSRDPTMIEIFNSDNDDVHSHMGAEIAGIPFEEFDKNIPLHKDWRQKAKPVNFGFLYGQMPPGFVRYAKSQYGITFTLFEAEDIRDRYFSKYTGLQSWYREVYDQLYRLGYVRTEFGRLRRFPGLFGMERWQQEACERQAVNTLVQSVAADIMLMIFIYTQGFLVRDGFKTRLILTVHDSLLGEGPPEEMSEIARRIDAFVRGLEWPWLKVPLKMDLERGQRFGKTKAMKKGSDF